MVNIRDLIDHVKCYETVRALRWPDGAACPHCSSDSVVKDGRDDTEGQALAMHLRWVGWVI